MHNPNNGVTGAVRIQHFDGARHGTDILTGLQVVSVYIAGEAVGATTQILIAYRLGRIRFMQLMFIVVTIGCAIQTGSVNMGMFLAGRGISGCAVGSVLILARNLLTIE